MQKVEDYKRHADECRQMAQAAANPEHRTMLLNMAATWDGLAQARDEHVRRRERIAKLENAR